MSPTLMSVASLYMWMISQSVNCKSMNAMFVLS